MTKFKVNIAAGTRRIKIFFPGYSYYQELIPAHDFCCFFFFLDTVASFQLLWWDGFLQAAALSKLVTINSMPSLFQRPTGFMQTFSDFMNGVGFLVLNSWSKIFFPFFMWSFNYLRRVTSKPICCLLPFPLYHSFNWETAPCRS